MSAAVAFGLTIGFGLQFIRNRTVRTLTLHSNNSRIFLQSVGHGRQKGLDVDKKACDLFPGRDDTETLLKVAGTRGTFRLDLMGAKIDGQPGTLLANRKRLRDAWYGVRLGGRWISGPHDTPKSSYA